MKWIRRTYAATLLAAVLSFGPNPVSRGDDGADGREGSSSEPKEKPILALDAGGHTAKVKKILFTPDGRQLVTVSDDKTVRVWDMATGGCLRVLRPPIGPGLGGMLFAAALSPDGRLLAVAGVGRPAPEPNTWGQVYLIDLPSSRIERVLRGHDGVVFALAFSSDGKRLGSASGDRTARVWDVATGKCLQVFHGHKSPIHGIAFAPDGGWIATASFDKTGRIWSVASGQCKAVLEGHAKVLHCVAWSPDGRAIATGGQDQSIRLWDADGKPRKQLMNLENEILSLTFTASGDRLLYTWGIGARGSTGAALLDLASGKVNVRFTRHPNAVMAGAISPDGSLAASAGGNEQETYVWRTADGAVIHRLAGKGQSVWAAAWAEGGKVLAWGNTRRDRSWNDRGPLERTWQAADLQLGDAPETPLQRARAADDSRSLQPGPIALGVKRGEETTAELKIGSVWCFTLLPRERAAVGSRFGLYLFDTRTGKQVRWFQGHESDVCAVAPSPDGRYLLSGSWDQTLRIWVPDRDEPLLSLFFAGHDWIAWTPEGYYACSPGGEKLMGWQVNNGPDKLATFYPADKFRKSLYRPDVIKRLLAAGSVEKALQEANQAGGKRGDQTDVSRVLPPRVAISAPRPGTALDSGELRVEAVASSVGQHPVTALRLLLDGRPYGGQASLKKVSRPQRGEVKQAWTVTLSPGKHHLAVQADSAVSQGTSEAVEVVYQDRAAAEVDRPAVKLYVLAIGINDYPDKLNLRCAADDARSVARAFEQHSKGLYAGVEVKVLTDDKASRKGVLDSLVWLRKQMTQRDVAVVFFAGHGARDSEGSLYLLPSDVDPDNLLSSAVSGEQVKKALAALPGRVLFLLDACHAGAAGGDKRRASEPLTDELVQDLATDDYGVVVMCAAMSREYSLESRKLGHGYFTQALVEGLQGKAARSTEGAVYLHHLDGYVTDRVKELTGGLQHPVTAKPTSIRSFPLSRP